ncbi:MAG: hypothetical protein AAF598_12995 [Bacteroidota bacterium]
MSKWSRASIKAFINTDRGTLILCMVLAFIFWLFTKMANTYETDIQVEVNYQLPEGKTLIDPPPSTIEAKLSGGGWKLLGQALNARKPIVNFQLNNNVNQVISPRMQESIIEKALRNDYQIVSKSLENITLQLDNIDTVKIPIRVSEDLSLAPQHQLQDSIRFSPDSIWAIGPESLTRTLDTWTTGPVSKQALDADYNGPVPVKPHLNRQIRFEPKEINIQIDIEQFTEKQLTVPVNLVNVPDSLMILLDQEKVNLKFIIGLSEYDRINVKDFRVIADFNDVDWAIGAPIPVEVISAPNDLNKIEVNPAAIEFLIKKINQ